MKPSERIEVIQLLELMKHQPESAENMGMIDRSFFFRTKETAITQAATQQERSQPWQDQSEATAQ